MRFLSCLVVCLSSVSYCFAAPITWNFTASNGVTGAVVFDDSNPNFMSGGVATSANGAILDAFFSDPGGHWELAELITVLVSFGPSVEPDDLTFVTVFGVDSPPPISSGKVLQVVGVANGNLTASGNALGFPSNPAFDGSFSLAAAPEPASVTLWLLLGTGLMGFGWMRHRKHRAKG